MKRFFNLCAVFALTLGLNVFAAAQETTTTTTTITKKEVVQNPDGTYTVIEYPIGKEVTVELTPYNLQGAKGWAKVLRADDGTTVMLDLSGLPAEAKNYYVYAVDPTGATTFLGPAVIEGGISKVTFNTPLDKFMLVLSPDEGITAFDAATPVVFRSAVPTGHAIVPMVITDVDDNEQKATSAEVASTYQVPMLGVPGFNEEAEIKINFTGELQGLKGKAYVDPEKGGVTKIKMRFDDMKMAPKNKRFVLWAASPDGKYTKLGQVINDGNRQESEIRSETAMKDFGLFVTVEETDVAQPSSKIYSVFTVNP